MTVKSRIKIKRYMKKIITVCAIIIGAVGFIALMGVVANSGSSDSPSPVQPSINTQQQNIDDNATTTDTADVNTPEAPANAPSVPQPSASDNTPAPETPTLLSFAALYENSGSYLHENIYTEGIVSILFPEEANNPVSQVGDNTAILVDGPYTVTVEQISPSDYAKLQLGKRLP